jgi:hypothetical protein
MKIDGIKLMGNRELWRRVFCQYERQELIKSMQRFHTSQKHQELAGGLELYDAETLRLLREGGYTTD